MTNPRPLKIRVPSGQTRTFEMNGATIQVCPHSDGPSLAHATHTIVALDGNEPIHLSEVFPSIEAMRAAFQHGFTVRTDADSGAERIVRYMLESGDAELVE